MPTFVSSPAPVTRLRSHSAYWPAIRMVLPSFNESSTVKKVENPIWSSPRPRWKSGPAEMEHKWCNKRGQQLDFFASSQPFFFSLACIFMLLEGSSPLPFLWCIRYQFRSLLLGFASLQHFFLSKCLPYWSFFFSVKPQSEREIWKENYASPSYASYKR